MSLPTAMTALLDAVGDEIGEYLGEWYPEAPLPERALRYHGSRPMPQDCCTEAGYLVVQWTNMSRGAGTFPKVKITIQYVTCWPGPETGTEVRDDDWDASSARYAGVAEAVSRLLLCIEEGRDVPVELTRTGGCAGFKFTGCNPVNPAADCAGVEWTSTLDLIGRGTLP
jgi:hypothetical protein